MLALGASGGLTMTEIGGDGAAGGAVVITRVNVCTRLL
jgi:hypothetical protein